MWYWNYGKLGGKFANTKIMGGIFLEGMDEIVDKRQEERFT